jgi:hypothetical protein
VHNAWCIFPRAEVPSPKPQEAGISFSTPLSLNVTAMKRIFYKGEPYESLAVDIEGRRKYALYQNDQFMHFIDEEELDKKSRVSIILDNYYEALRSADKSVSVLD